MKPVRATPEQQNWWDERDGAPNTLLVIGGPAEGPDVIPCPTVVSDPVAMGDHVGRIFHVALQLDEIEVAHLAQGGTLWLTTWGGLPIHLVEVEPPGGEKP